MSRIIQFSRQYSYDVARYYKHRELVPIEEQMLPLSKRFQTVKRFKKHQVSTFV